MQIQIYGKKNCMKCKTTKLHLPNANYTELDLDDPKIQEFRDQGIRAMPVVQVFQDGVLIEQWNDFNFNKIREYANAMQLA